MRLDTVTAEIRPRGDWEAVDLGFAMVRRSFWRCITVWWLALGIPTAIAAVLLWDHPMFLLALFWWVKPAGSRLVLFELNEVNFDIVGRYIEAKPESFPALRTLLAGARARTTAEKNYDELEPWIQWASVHTGLSYGEHGVYRLGDIVGSKSPQMFEQLEAQGLRLGCVSPMNAENRLQSPAYFIPDPWTKTAPDRAWWSRVLAIRDEHHHQPENPQADPCRRRVC